MTAKNATTATKIGLTTPVHATAPHIPQTAIPDPILISFSIS